MFHPKGYPTLEFLGDFFLLCKDNLTLASVTGEFSGASKENIKHPSGWHWKELDRDFSLTSNIIFFTYNKPTAEHVLHDNLSKIFQKNIWSKLSLFSAGCLARNEPTTSQKKRARTLEFPQ